jgi:hypothetical protein
MYLIYDVISFRYTAIDSVIDSVTLRYKIKKFTLSKPLIRWANKR